MARLVYLGTPELAVAPLNALVAAGHDVALVVSQPDARRGRGSATSPSPVKAAALELGIAVSDDPSDLLTVNAEAGVVVAYGRLLAPALVHAMPLVNLHFSLLPRWRGAAPVERAILAGDRDTGVCVMAVEEGLDTGAVYASATVAGGEHTLTGLQERLVTEGCRLLVDAFANGVAGLPVPVPQAGVPTVAKKIRPEELHLDWSAPAEEIRRVIRLGRAFTHDGTKRLRILEAVATDHVLAPGHVDGTLVGTGTTAIALIRVQPEGKAPMDGPDWARGRRTAEPFEMVRSVSASPRLEA